MSLSEDACCIFSRMCAKKRLVPFWSDMDCRGTVRYELHVSGFSEVLQAWAAQAGTSHCKFELLREGGFLINSDVTRKTWVRFA